MREAGYLRWLGLNFSLSHPSGSCSDYLKKILDVFFLLFFFLVRALYVEQMSALCFRMLSECRGSQGWSAVTTEPFAGPQPMSQSLATIGHFPLTSTTRTANRATDFGGGGVSHPALNMVLYEPNSIFSFTFNHTCFFCFFCFLFKSIHIGLTCSRTQPMLPSFPYLCFYRSEKKPSFI